MVMLVACRCPDTESATNVERPLVNHPDAATDARPDHPRAEGAGSSYSSWRCIQKEKDSWGHPSGTSSPSI